MGGMKPDMRTNENEVSVKFSLSLIKGGHVGRNLVRCVWLVETNLKEVLGVHVRERREDSRRGESWTN